MNLIKKSIFFSFLLLVPTWLESSNKKRYAEAFENETKVFLGNIQRGKTRRTTPNNQPQVHETSPLHPSVIEALARFAAATTTPTKPHEQLTTKLPNIDLDQSFLGFLDFLNEQE